MESSYVHNFCYQVLESRLPNMNTTMPSPSSSQACCELIQPPWKGTDNVKEGEVLGAIRQVHSLYTTIHPAPPFDILRSASPSASTRFGVEAESRVDGPDGQPLIQCTPPPMETSRFDQHAQSLPRLGLVSASPNLLLRSRRHAPPTQSRHVRSRSNPQTSNNSHCLQPSDDRLPNEPSQVNTLRQDSPNSSGSTVSQSQVPSPRSSTTIPALDCSTEPPGRHLLTLSVPSRRMSHQSNPPQSSPQEPEAQPARQSITNGKITLESLNYCSPPSKASFDFSSPAPQCQITDPSQWTAIPNGFRLSPTVSIFSNQDTQIPVLNERSKSAPEPLIPRSKENLPRPIKMPHRHMSKDDTCLGQIASSVAASAPPRFQASKGPKDSEPSPRTETERLSLLLCPSTVDASIRDAIMNRVNKEGHVYIFKSPEYFRRFFPNEPPMLKIGMAKDVSKRMEYLKGKCGLFDLTRVADCQDRPMEFYWKVEELVHTELQNFRRLFNCKKCRNAKGNETEHQEWFAVEEEVALRSVQRWRRFIELEPYDENGILKDHWSRMIQPKNMEHPDAEEQWNDSRSRDIRWTKWLDKGAKECENV